MTGDLTPGAGDVLVIVDVQNDFCPGGALAVPGGDAVVPVINRISPAFAQVVLAQDWHPPGHQSFASSHPGRQPFETIEAAYGPQTLWPDHCVQGTPGAAFHADLETVRAEMIIRKGYRAEIDSYSAFFENDRKTATGLRGYLRERGLGRAFLCGLAGDYCVAYSAIDAAKNGLEVIVIEDACRAIDLDGSLATAREAMTQAGVRFVDSSALGA
jgi:nicotinamidase/pyrazinamidase